VQTVTVDRNDLLKRIKENREQHRSVFEAALKGYRTKVISELDKSLADAKAGRNFRTFIALAEPVDQTKDYDRIIGMLEMSVDQTIDLTEDQFSQYVLDDWSWKRNFTEINTSYIQGVY